MLGLLSQVIHAFCFHLIWIASNGLIAFNVLISAFSTPLVCVVLSLSLVDFLLVVLLQFWPNSKSSSRSCIGSPVGHSALLRFSFDWAFVFFLSFPCSSRRQDGLCGGREALEKIRQG